MRGNDGEEEGRGGQRETHRETETVLEAETERHG